MSANQGRFRVATMARVLGVSPSGYYAWRQRPPSARAQADAELTARVQEIHAGSRGTYGASRIHAELVEAGVAVGRKRVARVMREAGIAGVSRRRGPRTTTSPTFRPWQASSTWPSFWMFSVGGWSAGPWLRTCARSWWSRRWRWPWRNAGPRRSSIIPTRAASTRRWPSAPAAVNQAWRCRWVRWEIASTVSIIVLLSGGV